MDLEHLPNMRKGEKVHIFLRRHWIEVFRIIATFTLLLLVPVAFFLLFQDAVTNIFRHDIFGPIAAVVLSIYILGIWLLAFIDYMDYYLDVWIVTDERIINIEQPNNKNVDT